MAQKAKQKAIFIASSPNTEKDDLIHALKLLFTPWAWFNRSENSDFTIMRKLFANYHSVNQSFLYNTGRAALHELLLAMNIGEGDEVIIPGFTCVAVPTSILWRKATPIYIDINPATYNADPATYDHAITPQTRAVIVQHTFGEIADTTQLRTIIEKHNAQRPHKRKIYLIEDCAHSFGTIDNGRRAGEWGDAAFFSFGQEKVISCTQGGAAIAKNKEIEAKLAERYTEIQDTPIFTVNRMILHPILWSCINSTYFTPGFSGKATIGRGLIVIFRLMGMLKPHADTKTSSLQGKPDIKKLSNAQASMLKTQFEKLDKFMTHRIEISEIYQNLLKRGFSVPQSKFPRLRFPLQLSNREHLSAVLKKHRIILGNWYSAPIHPAGVDYETVGYIPGSCRHSEIIVKKIINLPTHIHVTRQDAQMIAEIVLKETQSQ